MPVLLFLHIPRTAGTTLNRVVRLKVDSKREILVSAFRPSRNWHQFVAHARSLPRERLSRIRYFRGHFSFGIHEHLPKPAKYFTVLRDPVDRVLSSYFFFIKRLGSDDVTIEDFVRKGREGDPRLHIGWTDNVQVRMLAAHAGEPVHVPIGSCTTDMLELAQERIASDLFLLTGLTERFDESILLLKNMLGWRNAYYVPFNIAKAPPHSHDLPEGARDMIHSYNGLDQQLYDFANGVLDEEVAKAGPAFSRELETFRSRNRVYAKMMRPIFRELENVSRAFKHS
jgi:hypothetical protein